MKPRIPRYVLLLIVLWALGLIPCVNWCPPPDVRVFWLQNGLPWCWCCE